MKLEVGKFYKTRGGYKAQVFLLDSGRPSTCQKVLGGVLTAFEGWATVGWTADGQYNQAQLDAYDIIEEWHEPLVGWINVYTIHAIHPTKESADRNATTSRIRCVKVLEVEE